MHLPRSSPFPHRALSHAFVFAVVSALFTIETHAQSPARTAIQIQSNTTTGATLYSPNAQSGTGTSTAQTNTGVGDITVQSSVDYGYITSSTQTSAFYRTLPYSAGLSAGVYGSFDDTLFITSPDLPIGTPVTIRVIGELRSTFSFSPAYGSVAGVNYDAWARARIGLTGGSFAELYMTPNNTYLTGDYTFTTLRVGDYTNFNASLGGGAGVGIDFGVSTAQTAQYSRESFFTVRWEALDVPNGYTINLIGASGQNYAGIPEPSTCAALAGVVGLALATMHMRNRKRN